MEVQEYIHKINEAGRLLQKGEYQSVIQLCNAIKEARPERMGAYLILAQTYLKQEELSNAQEVLQSGVEHSDEILLKVNLAIVLNRLNEFKEAHEWFKKAKATEPSIANAKFWFYYAKNAFELGNKIESIEYYEKCLQVKPDHKAALNNLANLYQKRENLTKAESYYKRLIEHYPQEGMAYSNLASLYERAKKADLAVKFYQKALEVDRSLSIVYYNLGQLYANEKREHHKALEVYSEGIKYGDATYQKGIRFYQIITRQHIVDWSHYEEDTKDLNEIIEWYVTTDRPPFEIIPYALSYSKLDPQLYRKVAERYAAKLKREILAQFPDREYDHTLSYGKIKVGYLSPNFRQHPGGTLVRELFDYHDHHRFEIHAFSLTNSDDWINREIQDSVDYYHNVSAMSSVEIADLINRTGIDILVSLAGYNTAMKFDVMALKPAPIQINAIGSHETTGADYIDYVLSDSYMLDEELRKNFSEKVIIMPCSSLINSSFPIENQSVTTRADHNLPEDSFVFANFNHPKKIDPETFDAWITILKESPQSILWLYNGGQDSFAEKISAQAAGYDIDSTRIVFAKPVDIRAHWERMKHADLFLDNFIYNAHVTGIEALRMGVPMISLKGPSHNSRLSSSLLHFSGNEKLICLTKNDYITLSVSLAASDDELDGPRKRLQAIDNVVLFDTELQVKYLEKAYLKALLKFKKGLEPEDFEVGSALDLNSLLKN